MLAPLLILVGIMVADGTTGAAPVTAQSTLSASIRGTVTDETGRPIPRTVVTLRALAAGASQEAVTGPRGTYVFRLAAPGTYELRAEAIGYQPLVARTFDLAGGDDVRLTLVLTVATPPVVAIDTISVPGTTTGRARAGGLRFGSADVDELPYRFGDLGGMAARSPWFDDGVGSQGLPGSMSLVFADGLPVHRPQHPSRREEHLADAFFPRSLVSSVTAMHHASDVEWAGAAGGYASVATRSAVTGGVGAEIEGAWSGTPLWSSGQLALDGTPDLTSFQGAGRARFDITPETSQLLLATEVLQHEAPMAPRIAPGLASDLEGIDSELLVSLAAPSVERVSRYSGLGRYYTQPSETSRVLVRGIVSHSERTFAGPGPLPVSGAGLDETSTEFSIASSFVSEIRPGVTLDLRGGISGSDRTFESAVPGLPSAYLVESGVSLGAIPGVPAEVGRTDAVFLPMATFDQGPSGTVKVGASARASRHDFHSSPLGAGDFLFSDQGALLAGRGLVRASGDAEAKFSTREFGAFAQYDVTPSPGLDLSVGARIDHEQIPLDGPRANDDWLLASGLPNDAYPRSFSQYGGHASVSWDPLNDGRTRISGVGSVHSGDLDTRYLFETLAFDGSTETRVHTGPDLAWPEATVPGSATALPVLALLGPDVRPPRSMRGSVDVVREIAGGLSLRVSGDFRRTDFLMRRRNLNLPTMPSARNQTAQDVYGALSKDGALVTATGDDARRFPAFGAVWALDPDGWSEYRGVTAGVEYRGERLDLYGAFTRSETKDNWVGAAAGSPEAELEPLLPAEIGDWSEGRSDYDVPNVAVASALVRIPSLPGTSFAATYRFSSGRPFTPGYRRGVDANGDGSFENDVAVVPQPDQLGALSSDWACLRDQSGRFAVRNSCRGPSSHDLGVRVRIGLGRIGGSRAGVFVEGLNLIESKTGLIDDALVLVTPDENLSVSGDGTITIPLEVNPDFGRVMVPASRGRMLRVGMRIGG